MNAIIDFFNTLPMSLIDKIYATPFTTWVLYAFVFLFAASLLRRNKQLLKIALGSLLLFVATWSYGKIKLQQQKKMIVYNVSRHTAIDFISNNKYWFYGDDAFKQDGALQNFNLKPARVSLQVKESKDNLAVLKNAGKIWQFYDKKVMIIDSAVNYEPLTQKMKIDVLIICKKPKINISDITKAVMPSTVVFDASNSLWKIAQWKKECEELHLQYFITGEQGAFILDAN
jgi:competence protein ComEC